jgi:hypothetical protein
LDVLSLGKALQADAKYIIVVGEGTGPSPCKSTAVSILNFYQDFSFYNEFTTK